MKLLLDECVTRRLRRDFTGHQVTMVGEAGLKGLKNGQLLRAATGYYDVLITVDQNLPYQQNFSLFHIALLVFAGKRHDYATLPPLVPQALIALKTIKPGEVVIIRAAS